MFKEIYWFLGCGVLALFISLVTSALQIMGYIHVNAARIMLFLAWLIAVVGASAALVDAPLRHRAIAALLVGIPLGIVLSALERHAVKRVRELERSAGQSGSTPKTIKPVTVTDEERRLFEAFNKRRW